MRLSRSSLALALLVGSACVSTTACSSDPAAPEASPEEREASLQAKLEGDTGVAWKVIVDRQTNEVSFLAPYTPTARATPGGTPEEKGRALFLRYASELGVTDLEQLRVIDETTDTTGLKSVRFAHVLSGTELPIFDASSLAEFTTDGSLLHAQPGFRRDLGKVARSASVPAEAAEKSAIDHVRTVCEVAPGDAAERKASTLGVSAEPGKAAALAWAVDVRPASGACVAPRVFVDAVTGAVLRMRETAAFVTDHKVGGVRFHKLGELSDVKDIDVTKAPDLLGDRWVMKTENASTPVSTVAYGPLGLEKTIVARTLGAWEVGLDARGAAVDAHYYTSKALDYFKQVHQREGLDGKGSMVTVMVHDRIGANASYCQGFFFSDDQLHIGDGGGALLPMSAGFDFLTHELAHGVTRHTSKLRYEGESGALNEAFSDVMAASAENWLPETRSATGNVLIGEKITKNGWGFRNMADPTEVLPDGSTRDDVDHYSAKAECSEATKKNDWCDVHSNSGIANRAFTLMTLGGLHKGSKVAVAKGIGWERSRSLWFNSFTKLQPNASFMVAAYTQLAHAALQGPEVLSAVGCAWFAVGVLAPVELQLRNVACVGSNPVGLVTPPPSASGATSPPATTTVAGCEGRTSSYICTDATPGYAMPCNATLSEIYCADASLRCKPTSATDPTAMMDADGALICE